MRLLHVEDDHAIAALLRRRLQADGITVDHAPDVATARRLLAQGDYAAVILDLQMPDGNGLDLLRRVRAAHHAVPVLVLSGAGSEETIIRALEAGADDFVAKPVSLELLRAHVRALVRRGGASHGDVLRIGDLVIDVGRRETWVDGQPITLTTLEFNLLAYLAARPGQVQERTTLLTAVWGQHPEAAGGASNVVDVTIGRVRKRIGEGPGIPVIAPVRGMGYVLREPEA